MNKPVSNLLGTTVEVPKGPGSFIGKRFRELVTSGLNCIFNDKILMQYDDGSKTGVIVVRQADIQLSPRGRIVTIPFDPLLAGIDENWPPVELDTSVGISPGQYRLIKPLHSIVTTGLVDLQSAVLEKARPGIWRTLQTVPAATSSGYNVPNEDYFNGAASPGAAMTGFWALIQEYDVCANNP